MTMIGLVSAGLVILIRMTPLAQMTPIVMREQHYLRRIKRCGLLGGRESVGIRL